MIIADEVKFYGGIALAVALVLCGWRIHAAIWNAGYAEGAKNVGVAVDANTAQDAAIARLKMSVAQCETGRLVDQSSQQSMLASRASELEREGKEIEKARNDLSAVLMSGTCKDWASQAACGSVR